MPLNHGAQHTPLTPCSSRAYFIFTSFKGLKLLDKFTPRFFFFCSFPVKARRWSEIFVDLSTRCRAHKVVIRRGNAFCLQNLGACCGCLELFVDSPVSYPLHLLLSWAHMVGSPLCMPGLSWETEAYMAQWKPLTRAALPSIFTRASPTSTSFLFFFLTNVQVVCFVSGAWKLWITER